eukprot:jgi/Tetstr1/460549/TSEL_005807.t1
MALCAGALSTVLRTAAAPLAVGALRVLGGCGARSMALWSKELEKGQTYKSADDIIQHDVIERELEATKSSAKDPRAVGAILEAARERSFLTGYNPAGGGSEYVQGLTYKECATLLNVDVANSPLMEQIYETAYNIKERIYGNRIVLFAPLYIANHCVNNCAYCAFRADNKNIARSILTDQQLREEVVALEKQGHRRLLVLTGEHPKYTFDQFLNALKIIAETRSEPCGQIRRCNVEIPSLSLSDMKRLKATNVVGTYTLFQETYHRPTFAEMHISGPKSKYDNRLLTHDRAMRAGLDDVGIGTLFGLYDYKYEVMAMLMHANHLEAEYGAGPHTISVPRMRAAEGSDISVAPPYEVDDPNFKKLVAILRIAVPYTGMILSTRESPEMRRELLKVGMSQMSAGSRTDVGAYHRQDSTETRENLGNMAGQFSLLDERPVNQVVLDLMEQGYVPSWCTACYRKGRTGEHFMKIAKAGNIHNFCHPNSLLTLQEYLNDYGTPAEKAAGQRLIKDESERGFMSDQAVKLMNRKMKKVNAGEHDVYI